MLAGEATPTGLSRKQFMYDCFVKDVARGLERDNAAIPARPATGRLRVVSYNVHFFRAGFSDVELRDSFDEVMGVISHLDADVCLLQEVPMSLVSLSQERLRALGYAHSVAAGSADVHVLAASSKSFAGERLHVLLASKLPMAERESVPMLDGHAAFAEIELPPAARAGGGASAATLLVYSVHLSVR